MIWQPIIFTRSIDFRSIYITVLIEVRSLYVGVFDEVILSHSYTYSAKLFPSSWFNQKLSITYEDINMRYKLNYRQSSYIIIIRKLQYSALHDAVHIIVHTTQYLHTAQCTLYCALQCTIFTQCTLHTIQCTVYTAQF